jgi:transposase InsO family protein
VETAFLHLKKTVRGAGRILRGRSAALARQEAWALLLVHNMIAAMAARTAVTAGTSLAAVSFTAVPSLAREHVAADTRCRHCGKRPTDAGDPLARLTAAIATQPLNRQGRKRTSGEPPPNAENGQPRKPIELKGSGPGRGVFYHLYAMLDIFSRCALHWEIHATELGELAEGFIEESFRVNGGIIPAVIHSDRGTSMTSKPVAALLADLDILKSHSRPKVSNDNLYSEAQFKTLKYCPVFPEQFGSLQDARAFGNEFFTYYNHHHYHSGIGLHAPYSGHIGTAEAIQEKRQAVRTAAYAANPARFTRRPAPPKMPRAAWINKPNDEQPRPCSQSQESTESHEMSLI